MYTYYLVTIVTLNYRVTRGYNNTQPILYIMHNSIVTIHIQIQYIKYDVLY